jgi:hypothetical protein
MTPAEFLARRLEAHEESYRALAVQLSQVGYLWHGTVVRQTLTCGKSTCACHRDPRRRHGPYAYWSTKVKGRTVSRLLNPEEAVLYEEWIQNRRRIETIQRKMLGLSRRVAPLLLKQRKSVEKEERR